MGDISFLNGHLDYIFLLFLRVSGLLICSPIFGRKNVPNLMKISMCAVMTFVFAVGLMEPQTYPSYNNLLQYALICIREMLFGAAMGFIVTVMFNLTYTAGGIMDYQIGFSMASVYDPQTNGQTPITGSLFNFALLVIFLGYDGHLRLIDIIFRTFQACPVGMAMAPKDIMWVAVDVVSNSFVMAVMLAMPVLAAGILTEVALGVIIKNVPQMNMFVVGIPLKLIVGLIMLILTLALFVTFTKSIFTKTFDYIGIMFNYLEGTG